MNDLINQGKSRAAECTIDVIKSTLIQIYCYFNDQLLWGPDVSQMWPNINIWMAVEGWSCCLQLSAQRLSVSVLPRHHPAGSDVRLTEQLTDQDPKQSREDRLNLLKIRLHPRTIQHHPDQKRREHKVHTLTFTTSGVLARYDVGRVLKQEAKDCESRLHPEGHNPSLGGGFFF